MWPGGLGLLQLTGRVLGVDVAGGNGLMEGGSKLPFVSHARTMHARIQALSEGHSISGCEAKGCHAQNQEEAPYLAWGVNHGLRQKRVEING